MVGGASHLQRRVVLLSGHCEIRAAAARLLRRVVSSRVSSRREVPPPRSEGVGRRLALALLLLRFAMDLASALAELATISDQKTKIERYKAVLQDLLAQQHVAHLQGFLEHLLAEDVPLVLSRQVLQELAVGLKKLPPAQLKEVGEFALGRVANRAVSFEEQVAHVREALADVYEGEEEWAAAAKMLAAIPLDSGYVTRTDGYKVEKYIKIAMLYLQDDDSVSAETFINRASLLVTEETDGELRLQHKVCYARILDAKRKFLEAGTRFYQLSTLATKSLGEGKQVDADSLLPHAARPAIERHRSGYSSCGVPKLASVAASMPLAFASSTCLDSIQRMTTSF